MIVISLIVYQGYIPEHQLIYEKSIQLKFWKCVSLCQLFQFKVCSLFSSGLGGSLHSHHGYCDA